MLVIDKKQKFAYITACFLSICALTSTTLANTSAPLKANDVSSIIKKSHLTNDFHLAATPEVIQKINFIRNNQEAKQSLQAGLQRMKTYQPYIQAELTKKDMPMDLLVIPLVESRYKALEQSQNLMQAAGIWQIIPSTAKRFGLVINNNRDDRLDTALSTKAALTLLGVLYEQFHDWKLAALAYEIGENETERLIDATGSRDVWTLVRSDHVTEKNKASLKDYVAMLDASILIMHNPSLITQ
jgi:membrane-bound lytic murein transglycosylase D